MALPRDVDDDEGRRRDDAVALDLRRRRSDAAPPGFEGRIAVGVRGQSGSSWWCADFGRAVTTSFVSDYPNADALVGFDHTTARAVLGLQPLPEHPVRLSTGKRELLESFLRRYLGKTNMIGAFQARFCEAKRGSRS